LPRRPAPNAYGSRMEIRVGLKLAPQFTTIDELRAVWRLADEAGFDHVWNFDHFASIKDDTTGDIFEGWTLLGAMAEATSRVRIGCMVTGNTYRHPGVLAKMAVTVDHLSGGRLECGLGAAWAEGEHRMLGLEFGTVGQRIARLEEACRVCKALWTEDRASFHGDWYRLDEAIANPKPVQQPYPPIWIGGTGERKTLRVVAEHADVWNCFELEVDEAQRLQGVLDAHCDAVGRDRSAVRRSLQLAYGDDLVERVAAYAGAGFTDFIVYASAGHGEEHGAATADLLPRLRELG
jgi:F420-dependent oxidoreductase-like protein